MKLTKAKTIEALNKFEATGACFWNRAKRVPFLGKKKVDVALVWVRHQSETGAQWGNARIIQAHFGSRSLGEIEIDRLSGHLVVEVKL